MQMMSSIWSLCVWRHLLEGQRWVGFLDEENFMRGHEGM